MYNGSRHSGKTTLRKVLFKGKPYLSFKNPAQQENADAGIAALVFHDTGLLCYLLHITSQSALKKQNNYGAIFLKSGYYRNKKEQN